MAVTESKQCVYPLIHPFIPSWLQLYTLWTQSKRLVTTLASLHTQTALHCLTIQVLNTRVCFIDIWYTSLTSVHYNLEYALAIVTKSFSPLDLEYTTSFVKVQIEVTWQAMLFLILSICHAYWTGPNWFGLVTT